MFAVFDVKGAKFEVRQIDLMLHFALAHQKVTGLDISVEDVTLVQIFDALEYLQSDHQNGFEAQSPSTSQSESIYVLSELLKDEIGSFIFLEGLLDFREAMKMRLFQLLIGLYFVLNEGVFILGVAFEDVGGAVFLLAALQQLVLDIFDSLHHCVPALYHQVIYLLYPQLLFNFLSIFEQTSTNILKDSADPSHLRPGLSILAARLLWNRCRPPPFYKHKTKI